MIVLRPSREIIMITIIVAVIRFRNAWLVRGGMREKAPRIGRRSHCTANNKLHDYAGQVDVFVRGKSSFEGGVKHRL